mgnify:CR=1 FL=1
MGGKKHSIVLFNFLYGRKKHSIVLFNFLYGRKKHSVVPFNYQRNKGRDYCLIRGNETKTFDYRTIYQIANSYKVVQTSGCIYIYKKHYHINKRPDLPLEYIR